MPDIKTMLVTIPIRPQPAGFAPIGSLSIVNYLRKHGDIEVDFFDIDGLRPTYEDALKRISQSAPDVLGISAVVSTSYAYTRRLANDVRRLLPDTLIVVGGSMAASAEVLLDRTPVDLCVLGEGERIFLNIVKRAQTTKHPPDFADIPGIVLAGNNGELINTGYEQQLDKTEVYDVEWPDLEKNSDIGVYITQPISGDDVPEWLSVDARSLDPARRGKTHGMLVASKGCVAKCTFCHRWDKGIRYIPIDILKRRLTDLVARYDLGFLTMGDENFGTDKRWLQAFCEMVKPFDLMWRVGGMRVNCVSPEQLTMMHDAGCIGVSYGMETGSPKMLQIMEKKTKLEDNRNAFRWTLEAGLWTSIQLVVGMPGEDRKTIQETIDFTSYAMTLDEKLRSNDLSINYAQALPGTPLYEFARRRAMIGPGIDGEEEYLLRISDRDAHDEETTLNFTDSPTLEQQVWRPLITISTNYAYVRRYGIAAYRRHLLVDYRFQATPDGDDGYSANPKRLADNALAGETGAAGKGKPAMPGLFGLLRRRKFGLAMICYPVLAYRMRGLLFMLVLLKAAIGQGPRSALKMIGEAIRSIFPGSRPLHQVAAKSLRKIVEGEPGEAGPAAMEPLRKGR